MPLGATDMPFAQGQSVLSVWQTFFRGFANGKTSIRVESLSGNKMPEATSLASLELKPLSQLEGAIKESRSIQDQFSFPDITESQIPGHNHDRHQAHGAADTLALKPPTDLLHHLNPCKPKPSSCSSLRSCVTKIPQPLQKPSFAN
jgi:hypothetical protein